MALIKCPECNHDVSDKAEACPHCGYKLKETTPHYVTSRANQIYERDHNIRQVGGIIGGILLAVVGILCFCFCAIPDIKRYNELIITFVACGIISVLSGIAIIIYSAYRLKNY